MHLHTRLVRALVVGLAAFAGAAASANDAGLSQQADSSAPAASVQKGTAAELASRPSVEMVEVTVRMPDGRVLTRWEPKYASRVHIPEDPGGADIQTGRGGVSSTAQGAGGGGGGGGGGVSGLGGGGSSAGGGGGGGASSGGGPRGQFGGGGRGSDGGGGGGGDSLPQGGDSAPPQGRVPNVYTWDRSIPEQFDNMIQTILLDPRAGAPEALANRIAARALQQQPRQVVFRYWKELLVADRYPFDLSDPVELWREHGYRAGLEPYWTAVAQRLRQRGITPDYIVQDLEAGVRLWDVPADDRVSFFSEIFEHRHQLSSRLPAVIFSVDVDTFVNTRNPAGDLARGAYDTAAFRMRADIIRETMHQPFVDVYGRAIPHSNYNDMLPAWEVRRHSGDPWVTSTIHGISAPSTYLVDYSNASIYSRLEKRARWNHLITVLNSLRSAAATGPVHPWISPPGYGRFGADSWAREAQIAEERWLWENFMNHCMAMGIDTYILWNPGPTVNPLAASSDRYMDGWFSDKLAHHELLSSLPPIPFDADRIETNGYVTTYADFTSKVGVR